MKKLEKVLQSPMKLFTLFAPERAKVKIKLKKNKFRFLFL